MSIKLKTIISIVLSGAMLFSSSMTVSVNAVDTKEVLSDNELNDYIEEYIDTEKTPGLALTVVNENDVSYKNWGFDNISEQIPVTETTHFELASVSKAFTALSVLLLQEEGKLSINDSVSDYLPWFNVKWNGEDYDLKIWHLLNHTSGIPEEKTFSKIKSGTDDKLKEETARLAVNLNLNFEPGTDFEYCNLGYDILAYLTEVVAEKSFEEYVTTEIFQPIGMNDSGYDIPTAQGYQKCFGQIIEYNAPRFKGSQGDGYVITTTSDMSLWIKAQLGNMELPEKLKNAIEKSHHIYEDNQYIKCGEMEDGTERFYANGWIMSRDKGLLTHSGGNPNFTTMLFVDYDRNIGVFAASNIQATTPLMAADCVYDMMSGKELIRKSVITDPTDIIASTVAIAFLILLLVILILTITQKKRLSKESVSARKEKVKLTIKLIIFTLLLAVMISLPYLVGYNYMMAAVWMPYSVLTTLIIVDIDLIMLIISSIRRYIVMSKNK